MTDRQLDVKHALLPVGLYISVQLLSFYLHFLHLIRALFANTGTLSLTSNRIIFSNNPQSKANIVIALTVQSLTSEVTTISSSHSLSSRYRSPNLHALHREIHLQNYQGRNSREFSPTSET